MKGSFSEESLARFAELASQTQSADFSEGEVYDFTRCVRPNGTAYGTGGKCRKGTEEASQEKKAIDELGSMLPKGEKIVDSKGNTHTAAPKGELSEGQKARQKESIKIAQGHKKTIDAHKAHAANLRKQGKEEEAKGSDDIVAHHTRLMNDALAHAKKPAPDPKMQIDMNTPEGRWFARGKGF